MSYETSRQARLRVRNGAATTFPTETANEETRSMGAFEASYSTPAPVDTGDATAVVVFEKAIPRGSTLVLDVVALATKSDNSKSNLYKKTCKFRNEAGSITQSSTIDNAPSGPIDDATWGGISFDYSGEAARVKWTGKASTAITCGFAVAAYEIAS